MRLSTRTTRVTVKEFCERSPKALQAVDGTTASTFVIPIDGDTVLSLIEVIKVDLSEDGHEVLVAVGTMEPGNLPCSLEVTEETYIYIVSLIVIPDAPHPRRADKSSLN